MGGIGRKIIVRGWTRQKPKVQRPYLKNKVKKA
jgi:hypothetical protein